MIFKMLRFIVNFCLKCKTCIQVGYESSVPKYFKNETHIFGSKSTNLSNYNTWCRSLFEILSRSEIPCALRDDCSYRTKVHWLHKYMIFTFETTYTYKDLTELHMRGVCVCTEMCTCCLC